MAVWEILPKRLKKKKGKQIHFLQIIVHFQVSVLLADKLFITLQYQ